MSDGIVIDANVIVDFGGELREASGSTYDLILWLLENCGIGTNDFISQEWEDVCRTPWFVDWYTDELKNGRIRKIDSKEFPHHLKKMMRIKYGFPIGTRDLSYVICAYSTDKTKYIMTNNYHFFDPKCPDNARAKHRAREQRQGQFCRFLFDKLQVRVGMPEHCKQDFCT